MFLGHPENIIPENKEVNWTQAEQIKYAGLLKVRVIPPRSLYLPILPTRVAGGKIYEVFTVTIYIFLTNTNFLRCLRDLEES